MKQQFIGFRDRLLSAVAIGICIVLIAVAASTLEPTISTTTTPEPPKSTPTSGISLIALLYRLLNAVLTIFGIALDPPSGRFFSESVFGLIFSFLRTIYQHRFAIIAGVGFLTVLGLLYQYRHQLAIPRVIQFSDETAETTAQSSTTNAASSSWLPEPGSDPESVQEVWAAMVHRIDDDVQMPTSRTPSEWQNIAIAAGMPTEPVETITTTFRAVQYGPTIETAAQRNRVQTAFTELETRQEAIDE